MNGIRQNDQIKLVVWDLDDTFWNGTLSEGGGYAVTENIDSLRTLVDRGIMNAIFSKNDYNKAKRSLVELNRVVDSFVAAHAENTHLLDMRRIVTSRDKLTNNIRHYTREVYRDMAVKIEEIASEIEGNIMSTFRRRLRRFRRSTKRLIASCFKDLLKRM